jgi:hypothetical protein
MSEQTKLSALASYLDCDVEDIDESEYDESTFTVGKQEYLVLTDEESDERAAEYIKESLWAFKPDFLASYTKLPEKIFTMLSDECEDANDSIKALVERSPGGLEGFVEQAISADGRAHFLNTDDDEEYEQGDYFIYRIN